VESRELARIGMVALDHITVMIFSDSLDTTKADSIPDLGANP
jgi:hypothetical protein